jgi:hypothetical protein
MSMKSPENDHEQSTSERISNEHNFFKTQPIELKPLPEVSKCQNESNGVGLVV